MVCFGRGDVGVGTSLVVKAVGEVVVKRPAAKGNCVIIVPVLGNVTLGYNILADHSARFTLAGQKTEKIKLPVVGIAVAGIFDVIPCSDSEWNQLRGNFLGVVDRISVAAKLKVPKVFVVAGNARAAVFEIVTGKVRMP